MPAADKGKLDGIAAGATANATDAQLRDRATHTGAQAIGTVTGLQGALDAKASLNSPEFGGTPKVPTAGAGTNTTQAASTAFVVAEIATRIAQLVDSSPAALDTLNELAAALGDDPNFAATMSTALGNRLRVDTAAQGLNAAQKTNAKTNLDLQNVPNVDSQNAGNLTSGTVADARLPDALGTKRITKLRETASTPAISGGTLTIDCNSGNCFAVDLTANITNLAFTSVPATGELYVLVLEFVAQGTARTVAWPATVKFPGGTAPTLTATNGKKDTTTMYTREAARVGAHSFRGKTHVRARYVAGWAERPISRGCNLCAAIRWGWPHRVLDGPAGRNVNMCAVRGVWRLGHKSVGTWAGRRRRWRCAGMGK